MSKEIPQPKTIPSISYSCILSEPRLKEIREYLLTSNSYGRNKWISSLLSLPPYVSEYKYTFVFTDLLRSIIQPKEPTNFDIKNIFTTCITTLLDTTQYDQINPNNKIEIQSIENLFSTSQYLGIEGFREKVIKLAQSEIFKKIPISNNIITLHHALLRILANGENGNATEKIFARDINDPPYTIDSYFGLGKLDPNNINKYQDHLKDFDQPFQKSTVSILRRYWILKKNQSPKLFSTKTTKIFPRSLK